MYLAWLGLLEAEYSILCVCVYIYIYIWMVSSSLWYSPRERERERENMYRVVWSGGAYESYLCVETVGSLFAGGARGPRCGRHRQLAAAAPLCEKTF